MKLLTLAKNAPIKTTLIVAGCALAFAGGYYGVKKLRANSKLKKAEAEATPKAEAAAKDNVESIKKTSDK